MRISASAPRGGDVRDSVKRLSLTAENDVEQEFITAIYRVACYDDLDARARGIEWLRRELLSPPEVRTHQ